MAEKKIRVMQKILDVNDKIAEHIRDSLRKRGITLLNLMSSPGSGKTTLIEKTAQTYGNGIFVIEGDIQTTLDAQRISRAGLGTYQINTGPFGGDCHLEAGWIQTALDEIELDDIELLFVENIGNLVCPAEFDIGAHTNVLVLSVTEGEDKPLKYPLAFRNSHLCLISKIDLIPYLDIDINRLKNNILQINPKMKIIQISAKTGEGFGDWIAYLKGNL